MTKGKRAVIACLAAAGVIACLAAFIPRYQQINQKYPPPPVETYAIGEPLSYKGVEVTVQESLIAAWPDMPALFPDTTFTYNPVANGEAGAKEQMKLVLVTVNLKNIGEESQSVTLYTMVAKTLTWRNGLNLELFMDLNTTADHTPTIRPALAPGEEMTVILPYTAIKQQFPPGEWAAFKDLPFELQFDLYPVKKIFKLT